MTLVLLAGCTTDYFSLSYWQRDASGQTAGIGVTRTGGSTSVVLAGSVDAVGARFQNALARLGMQAQVTADAEGIKIAAVTRSGKQLSVALKRDMANGTEQTQVHMEWRGGSESEVESQLMTLVIGAGR
jgi:hypothetical protein